MQQVSTSGLGIGTGPLTLSSLGLGGKAVGLHSSGSLGLGSQGAATSVPHRRCCGSLQLCLPCATYPRFLPVPRCQPGWFNLQPHNPIGCSSCFCYGHSSACRAADGYEEIHIYSDFSHGNDPPAPGETEDIALPTSAKNIWEGVPSF